MEYADDFQVIGGELWDDRGPGRCCLGPTFMASEVYALLASVDRSDEDSAIAELKEFREKTEENWANAEKEKRELADETAATITRLEEEKAALQIQLDEAEVEFDKFLAQLKEFLDEKD